MHTGTMTAALATNPELCVAQNAANLFRAHAAFVASFLFRLGLEPSEIEDAVQEVFLIAHRQGGYQPGPAQPRTWLAAIAIRVAMKAKTRHRRVRRDRKVLTDLIGILRPTDDVPFEEVEARQIVQRILDQMDPERRAVLILFELEGEACDSIAAALGVEVGTVYSRLHRARQEFQRACERLDARRSRPVLIRGDTA
jgi:RNA polymerase sigma-70 factor (ECF subfamily)